MKFTRFISFFLIFILFSQSAFSLGKKDKDSDTSENTSSKEEKIPKEVITIDLLLDTKKPNPQNHFNWKSSAKTSGTTSSSSSTNSEKSYKDYFDALSGASKVHSTKYFREATLDSSKKNLRTPKGLRNLCLYAVANPESLSKDNFLVNQEGKKITITFSHRENSYKIESDENGIINVPQGFFIKIKEKPAEKPEKEVKTEEKKDEEEDVTEEAKPEEVQTEFQKDQPIDSLTAIFKGKLTANLTNEGILTLKGKIKVEKREEDKESK